MKNKNNLISYTVLITMSILHNEYFSVYFSDNTSVLLLKVELLLCMFTLWYFYFYLHKKIGIILPPVIINKLKFTVEKKSTSDSTNYFLY